MPHQTLLKPFRLPLSKEPSYEHGTALHKSDLNDALNIRYGWTILNLPPQCGCGAAFDLQHALSCPLGGYRTIQHNEARDFISNCMKQAGFSGVETEPKLQPLSGESFEYKSANKEDEEERNINAMDFGNICDRRISM